MNPQACWDWWGYTSHDFLTKEAPQIKAVYRMLERLRLPAFLTKVRLNRAQLPQGACCY